MTGLTAYAGLLATAEFKEGDAVFVSGAAGAVGQLVGQIARLKGASRVIGSAGSAEKVKYLVEELGFDAAFNYKDGPVAEQLAAAAPDGIDVYFDNVGGEHLEAAIENLNLNGRVTICGAISQYNESGKPTGPSNIIQVLAKRLTLRGMLVGDHKALQPQFVAEVGAWIASGELKYSETVVEGGVRQARATAFPIEQPQPGHRAQHDEDAEAGDFDSADPEEYGVDGSLLSGDGRVRRKPPSNVCPGRV